jgi:carboxylesterase
MSLLVDALGAAGFTVVAPLLPGHGTTVEDLARTTWSDWTSAASDALDGLRTRCDRVVVAGLSMGGGITAWLAEHNPDIAGIVLVNAAIAAVMPPDAVDGVRGALELGIAVVPGAGVDAAEPVLVELVYEQMSLVAALSLNEGVTEVAERLPTINCPVLLVTSVNDHQVPAATQNAMADRISGPVTRLSLSRSFHVATLDLEHLEVERRTVEFVHDVTTAT